MMYAVPVFFALYLAIGVLWLMNMGGRRKALALGIILVVLSWPVAFMVGMVVTGMDNGVCYSEAVDSIRRIAEKDGAEAGLYALERLPFTGYETSCSEVQEMALAFERGAN